MKFLYFVSAGSSDPTRASIPLHLAANGSVEVGHQVTVVIGGDAAEIIVGDNAETMQGVGVPAMKDLVAKLRDNEVPVYV